VGDLAGDRRREGGSLLEGESSPIGGRRHRLPHAELRERRPPYVERYELGVQERIEVKQGWVAGREQARLRRIGAAVEHVRPAGEDLSQPGVRSDGEVPQDAVRQPRWLGG
jgi:hypothetical protein